MPFLNLHTNYHISEERRPKLMRLLSKIIQAEAGKPESSIMISLSPTSSILFAGEENYSVFVEFKAISLDESTTTKLSGAICNALEQEMGISSKRIYVQFENVQGHMWGWDKQTFQTSRKGLRPS